MTNDQRGRALAAIIAALGLSIEEACRLTAAAPGTMIRMINDRILLQKPQWDWFMADLGVTLPYDFTPAEMGTAICKALDQESRVAFRKRVG
jgi:hypothetical protein